MNDIFTRKREQTVVGTDIEGIETVFQFLDDKGFIDRCGAAEPCAPGDNGDNGDNGDIRESRVLVSGGRGIKDAFGKLRPLARALNASVAASRGLVDSGIAPRRIQVGQSGKKVGCELYIAVGISGSYQHIVGLKNVKYLIAVNKNKNAPICSLADIVIEGDAADFAEKLAERCARDQSIDHSPERCEESNGDH